MEESKTTPKQIVTWEKSRKIGKIKFTLIYGAGWGAAMAVFTELCLAFIFNDKDALTIKSLLPRIIVLTIFGYFYSRWYWNNNEKKYQQWLENKE